ncbi:MAG: GNAT family N-acetyltransferase [Pirellulaceae bacterium]
MSVTLFKRYRMSYDLTRALPPVKPLLAGYEFLPWRIEMMRAHADTKYRSFRDEMDTNVFSCLGRADGCFRLMSDIVNRGGFIPEATWLLIFRNERGNIESCGTIQGVQTEPFVAAIQNVGIVPAHRGRGLGTALVMKALRGFQEEGMKTGTLEVTAHNLGAVRLYERLGFRIDKIVFKSAEVNSR